MGREFLGVFWLLVPSFSLKNNKKINDSAVKSSKNIIYLWSDGLWGGGGGGGGGGKVNSYKDSHISM